MTDLSAALGSAVWLALVAGTAAGTVALSPVELYVGLATLVLVPLGVGLVVPRDESDAAYRVAVAGQPPAALATVAGLASPPGSLGAVLLVVPWLGVAGAMALFGLGRVLSRGGGPTSELAIDAAFLYVPVGAVALLLHAAGISLRFPPIIVLLTAVHFHYAGFVLPLVVGLAGRVLAAEYGDDESTLAGRVGTVTTAVIVAGIVAIAIGITVSPLVELLAVAFFAAGVVVFAALVIRDVVPAVPGPSGILLGIAALSICWTMALALAFAYSTYPATPVIVTIPEMVRWHGSVNAFGFALPSLLAFRLLEGTGRS